MMTDKADNIADMAECGIANIAEREAASLEEALFTADYDGALLRPSPNFGDRRDGKQPYMLIMHYTAMATAEEAELRLTDPQSQVSAHYLVREDGTIVQLVAESKRAWHAGLAFWRGESDVNSCSIGIEIAYAAEPAGQPYPARQIKAVRALAQDILARHTAIKPPYVLGHSDVAPERKIDPGATFPWRKMARAGVGLYAPPVPACGCGWALSPGARGRAVAVFQAMLARYGYDIGVTGLFDSRTEWVTKAFQAHFRPARVDGRIDISTIQTLRRLLALAAAFV